MHKFICIFAMLVSAMLPLCRAGEADPNRPKTPEDQHLRAEREAMAAREQAERDAMQARAVAEHLSLEAREQAVRAALDNAKLEYELKRLTIERSKGNVDEIGMKKLTVEAEKAANEIRVQEARLMESRAARAAADVTSKAQAAAEPWKADITKALDRKVSFEFVDTPLTDACDFIRNISGVNVIVDPKSLEHGTPSINLRVADMKLADAFTWVCKLAGQRYELRNQSIFVTADAGQPAAEPRKEAAAVTLSGKLRVKLANGNEFEADSAVFTRSPELVAGIVEQTLGVSDRRIEGMPLAKDSPARGPLLQLLSAHARNEVKIEYHEELNLLLISGKNPAAVSELYRLARMGMDAHRQFGMREKPPAPPAPVPTPAPKRPPAEAQQF